MLLLHEPARLVGADRDGREIEALIALPRTEVLAGALEVAAVARIAGEVEVKVGGKDRKAAPQRLHAAVPQ